MKKQRPRGNQQPYLRKLNRLARQVIKQKTPEVEAPGVRMCEPLQSQ